LKEINILIVDDSKTIQKILEKNINKYFKEDHCTVYKALNGKECMGILSRENIDLILLDWNMPEMNGDQVVTEIRGNSSFNNIKIIMITTEGAKKNVLSIMKKGANGYIVKPFNPESLQSGLDRVVSRMRLREYEEIIEI